MRILRKDGIMPSKVGIVNPATICLRNKIKKFIIHPKNINKEDKIKIENPNL